MTDQREATFSFIRPLELSNPGRKTKRWELYAQNGDILGIIQWRSQWRCYVFEPAFPTIYEQVCLREIAAFIESETKAHKARAAA